MWSISNYTHYNFSLKDIRKGFISLDKHTIKIRNGEDYPTVHLRDAQTATPIDL